MTDALTERRLSAADLADAAGLSRTAGWNQLEADWRLMLRDGRAIGLAAPDGGVIASALTLPLGPRLAWISMVLVEPAWRRRGLGTRLLTRCIAQLTETGVIPGLDATPAGRAVYEPLGFRPLYGIDRIGIAAPAAAIEAPPPAGVVLRPLTTADLSAVTAWDTARTGMARAATLEHLQARLPDAAWLALRGDAIVGCVLGRDGRLSIQLGPLLADDAVTARALFARALTTARQPAILDVPDANADFLAWLHGLGAVKQRDYTRMVRGDPAILPPPAGLYAIAGPELG